MKKLYILLVFIALQQTGLCQTAPYVLDFNTNKCCGGGDQGMGSSFKVAGAGQINSVTFYHRNNQPSIGTLYIYKGNGLDVDSLLYQQNISLNTLWTTNPVFVVNLNTPVAVKKDSMYTVYLTGVSLRHTTGISTYANGTLWNAGNEDPTGDLDFAVSIGELTLSNIAKSSLAETIKVKLTEQGKNLQVEGAGKNIDLKLFTSNGMFVGETKGDNFKLPALQEGVYILQITKDQELISKKIFITQ